MILKLNTTCNTFFLNKFTQAFTKVLIQSKQAAHFFGSWQSVGSWQSGSEEVQLAGEACVP